jgi:hypothetical protein
LCWLAAAEELQHPRRLGAGQLALFVHAIAPAPARRSANAPLPHNDLRHALPAEPVRGADSLQRLLAGPLLDDRPVPLGVGTLDMQGAPPDVDGGKGPTRPLDYLGRRQRADQFVLRTRPRMDARSSRRRGRRRPVRRPGWPATAGQAGPPVLPPLPPPCEPRRGLRPPGRPPATGRRWPGRRRAARPPQWPFGSARGPAGPRHAGSSRS